MSEHGLNEAQRRAVTHPPGPLLVLAGAGSGKTRVLTRRVVHLIERHSLAPERVLAVTFTNKAAKEMRERVSAALRLGRDDPRPVILTFHSLGLRLLRRFREEAELPSGFTIFDTADCRALARRVLSDSKQAKDGEFSPEFLCWYIGSQKALRRDPREARRHAESFRMRKLASLYGDYQGALRGAGAVDFEDLLLEPLRLLGAYDHVREQARGLFDATLVDEYQDTNENQYLLVKELAQDTRNITVVGDDDQSIYGWRGADYRNLQRFLEDFHGAQRVALEVNYRSTAVILEAANAVVAGMPNRIEEKVLKPAGARGEPIRVFQCGDEEDEAVFVVRDLKKLAKRRHMPWHGFGILYRTNKQAKVLEEALLHEHVPYRVVGGQKFYEKKEVKDLLAFLRVIALPQDEISLRRIWNTPPRGLGATAQKRLAEHAARRGVPLSKTLGDAEAAGVSAKAAAGAAELAGLLAQMRARVARGERFPELARELLSRTNYDRELDRLYKDANTREAKRDALEALFEGMENFLAADPTRGLRDYLAQMALLDELDRTREEAAGSGEVTLMTVHASKGLEFDHVYLVGLEDGLFPSERSVQEGGREAHDEERRLFYVAITRAREALTISYCKKRIGGGKRDRPSGELTAQLRSPSPFLALLPPDVIERHEPEGGAGELRRARNKAGLAAIKAMLADGK